MTEQERLEQGQRVKSFDKLSEALTEVHEALKKIQSTGSDSPFTGNTSAVRRVDGITIHFTTDEVVTLTFEKVRLTGWDLSRALVEPLTELRDKITKEKAKL